MIDVIAPSLVDTFWTEGAVAVRGVIGPEWIDMLRDVVPELLERAYNPAERLTIDRRPGERLNVDGMWRHCEPFARFLFKSPVGDIAAMFLRSKMVRLYEDLLLYTGPGVEGAPWHRDAPPWPLTGRQLCSVWFSLESVTPDTGALRFVAGSHLDDDEHLDDAFEHRHFLTFATDPGDVVVFHPRLLHAADGSAPDKPRRTFTIRFTGDDVRWRPRRSVYHPWMAECGLEKGAVLDHPWFPAVRT